MPYLNEYANPYGYEPLVTDEFIGDRLKTFSFTPISPDDAENPTAISCLPIREVDSLIRSNEYSAIERAFAIDGSLTSADEESPFQLSALKIGVVVEDILTSHKLSQASGPVDPELLKKLYKTGAFIALLPGEGVFGSTPGEDTWQDKFREELFESFKHLRVPFSNESKSLLTVLRELAPSDVKTMCVACHESGRLLNSENSILLNEGAPYCPRCMREMYFTDFLFTESWAKEGSGSRLFLAMMLILERILLHGVIDSSLNGSKLLPWEKTVFITDGPLAVYSTHSLNSYLLDRLQSHRHTPLLMGLEKTGTYSRFANRADVQTQLLPGHIAMVTTEVANLLDGKDTDHVSKYTYTYGKRFFYRTKSGKKTFVLMVPPKIGPPVRLKNSGEQADDWANYPTLPSLCEFIEDNVTEQFGTNVAALAIVAKANHTASLPKKLSERFFNELISSL